MKTCSSSRLVSNPSSNLTPSTNLNPKGRNRRRSKQRIENFNLEELSPPIVTMADQRTMAQLLQAPTEGYEDAIVPAITADNFELKRGLLTLDDLVSKFINQFFPLSKTTNLHNEITNFQQRFDESFSEAWDRFKDLLRACPHHGFLELHQLDTFYNALKSKDQDSLNSTAGGNFLDKMPHECLAIIESKSKVCYSRNKPVVAKVSTNTTTFGISPDVSELKDMVKALLLDKKSQNQSHALVKAVEESCVTCGGSHSYRNCPATDDNIYRDNIQGFVSQASAVNYNQGNTSYRPSMMSNQIRPPGFPPALTYQALAPQTQGVLKENFSAYAKANDAVMRNMQTQGQNMQNQLTNLTDLITKFVNSNNASTLSSGTLPSNTINNPKSDLKAITTRSGVSYNGPQILLLTSFLPKVVENEPEATKDTVNPTNNRNTEDVQPQVVQSESPILTSKPVTSPIFEPAIALFSALKPNLKTLIPYPSRRNDERNHEKTNNKIEKFYQIFNYMSFEISFADALILMPKFASTLKALIGNKEKLSEMARTPLNEHCSMVLLKKLPEKLGDPGMAECLALADLGANINLMPFSVWKRLYLPDLTPTCMTLELADRSISHLVGVAEDVYVKAITFNLDQTLRYSANYSDMTAKRIDIIDMACEEYSQEVLGFSDTISSGNTTPFYDPIVSMTSPTLTPFRNSDFLLEEVDAFLAIEDEPTSSEFYQPYLNPEGDILILEAFFNDDPSLSPPNQRNYMPKVRKELEICKAKFDKSLVDESPTVKLKDLPPRLEYSFLEGDDKFPVIIAKDVSVEEKTALITVLKSHKQAIAWKLSDIKGIDPEFCTHKILMEEDFEPAVQHQRRVNPKIHDVIKQEVIKLLEAGLIYPISDSPWVSLLHCVPKKGGFTVVENKDNELILTRLVTGTFQWCMMAIFHDMIEKTMEVFMDDFFVFGNSFQSCLSHSERMLKRCEDTNLCLNWEKIHFMVNEDWDMPFELMYNASDLLLGQSYGNIKINISGQYTMPEFTFKVIDTKGAENLAADHLSRLENPHQNMLDPKEINESFPLETLNLVSTRGNQSTPWCISGQEAIEILKACHYGRTGGMILSSRGNKYILVSVDYLSKWVEAKALPTNDSRVVCKFLKNLFTRVVAPRAIISDRGTHFCNDQFTKVMQKYGVAYRLATPYHPQTNGQVEVSYRGLKRILERAVGENHASWSDKVDDALWTFRTAYKTPIGCTPYKLVYRKACHLHVELDHKAYWALKYANFDLKIAGDHRKVQINELNELRDQAYENSLIYKEKTKRLHDSKIKNRVFKIGDRVLLFNSRLKIFSGRLKTRWSGPLTISQVYPYSTIELSQPDEPNFKVKGHRLKHYFGEEVPKLVVPDLHTFARDH
nr:reverse transcriptase domain-containing protein [Tanacetum cinerariifolium]